MKWVAMMRKGCWGCMGILIVVAIAGIIPLAFIPNFPPDLSPEERRLAEAAVQRAPYILGENPIAGMLSGMLIVRYRVIAVEFDPYAEKGGYWRQGETCGNRELLLSKPLRVRIQPYAWFGIPVGLPIGWMSISCNLL